MRNMIEIKLKDGTVVTYDTPFDMDNDKLLVKFRIVRDGEGEGPWVRLHPDDLADHNNDTRDPASKVRLAVMSNDCLCGVPWLCLTPYRMMGNERPQCNMDELIDLDGVPGFVNPDTGEQRAWDEHREWYEEQRLLHAQAGGADGTDETATDESETSDEDG